MRRALLLAGLIMITVLSVVALLVFRRRSPGWTRLRVVDFCYPLIPVSYIALGSTMMVYGVIWQPGPSLCALGTIAAGAAVFRLALSRRQRGGRLAGLALFRTLLRSRESEGASASNRQ